MKLIHLDDAVKWAKRLKGALERRATVERWETADDLLAVQVEGMYVMVNHHDAATVLKTALLSIVDAEIAMCRNTLGQLGCEE